MSTPIESPKAEPLEIQEVVMCKCGKNPALPPHYCPYQSDLLDNDDPEYCTCCEECRNECLADI